jgi:hypothetical protein
MRSVNKMKMKMVDFVGTVSHATMRTEDLVPCFLAVLEKYSPESAVMIIGSIGLECDVLTYRLFAGRPEVGREEHYESVWDSEAMSYILNEDIWEAMEEIAPPGYYFGAHEGDGSDYGYWFGVDEFDLRNALMDMVDEEERFEELQSLSRRLAIAMYGADNQLTNVGMYEHLNNELGVGGWEREDKSSLTYLIQSLLVEDEPVEE